MTRPDRDTLACVTPACQRFRHAGQGNLGIRKVYGHAHRRLLRCRPCGAAWSARRGSALCNPQLPETTAEEVIHPRGAGGSVRATARLVQGWTETVARRWRVSGRHAERLPDQHGRALRPLAWALDAPWGGVTKSKNAAPFTPWVQRVPGGLIPPWPLTARWWCPGWGAHGPRSRPWLWGTMPPLVFAPGTCRRGSLMPLPAPSQPSGRCSAIGPLPKGGGVVRGGAGAQGWPRGKGKSLPKVVGWMALPYEQSMAKPVWSLCGISWGTSRSTRVWERVTTAPVVSVTSGKSARPGHCSKPGAITAG
jgi:hypothetical protein